MSTARARTREPVVQMGRGRPPRARKLRDAKDALYREHIIEVAERIFADAGFTATRMQDIAAEAGVSLAKLYQAWPSKDELYRGLLITRDRQMFERAMQAVGPVLQAPQSVEQVLAMLEAHLYFLLEHTHYLRMQLREGYAWYSRAAAPTSEEQKMWNRGVAQIGLVLDWGVRNGFFRPGKPVEQARMILSAQQTRFANWVMDDMRQPHAQVVAQIQADFVRICCRPAETARLLAADGSGLSDDAQQKIAALRGGIVPKSERRITS